MTQKEFRMDVVVPHLNYDGLCKSLKSLRKYTPPENIGKVILIDQNPTYQKDADEFVDLHIFTKGRNLGFAKSMNVGIRLSDEKYVLLMNDDVEMINIKWVDGIVETFNRYSTALGVNPSSPRNPRASGEEPVNNMGIDYKEEFSEEDYAKMLELGKGHIIDGICMFATIIDKEKLDKVGGVIPGKCWLDEHFWPGGGEDYDLNRRAYMTKNEDNKMSWYRMLGTNLSFIWHWWYSTKRISDGIAGVKHCGSAFSDKWDLASDGKGADIYGHIGKQDIPINIIKPLEDCI